MTQPVARPSTLSATDIVVPTRTSPNAIEPPSHQMFRRLRELKRGCKGMSSHDRALTLAGACILEGINTRSRLVGALKHLGLAEAQALQAIARGTGSHWILGDDEQYRVL